ncbi:hypothetical protein MUK70_03720 [Dyadobacter chenwenxiniae]|uniref:Uncharacterized protein n=1 Tax=Dyadobacter chenwenxiniae TaxID=2906456 RepID=A0A9X1TGT2_9BACT|nr:hypothetical protein [Dyadobacter chenwenxiniae]MCF0065861.1 hypothetical protein [Dyadobacter chenwenxiniae]UON84099.1 hypothetical protein MUK70_03720 [Dyadobacter chenwenxiniae]
MKTRTSIIIYFGLLCLWGCKKDQEPKMRNCGCDSEPEVILNEKGKIVFEKGEPTLYTVYWAGRPLSVCIDSTFKKILTENEIVDNDSIDFVGGGKSSCSDCNNCEPLFPVSIMSMKKI